MEFKGETISSTAGGALGRGTTLAVSMENSNYLLSQLGFYLGGISIITSTIVGTVAGAFAGYSLWRKHQTYQSDEYSR